MNRRALLAGAVAAPVLAATDALAQEADPGFMSFPVNSKGRLIHNPSDFWWMENEGMDGLVYGYELIGMPETYEVYNAVELEQPAPLIDWVRKARFPLNVWEEPSFVRVWWASVD